MTIENKNKSLTAETQRIFNIIYLRASAAIFCLCFLILSHPCAAQTADNVLLVVNDSSADSKAIGRYYAEKRKLPAANLCHLRVSDSETISRAAFERDILCPIADYLRSQGLQDQILYVVTTLGIPLVVEGDDSPIGDLASVDSELTLAYRYLITGNLPNRGRVENPYFAVEFNRGSFRPFVRRDYDIYLVTRLTAATASDVTMLVDRGLAAESEGDFYFDLASAQQSAEASWTLQAAAALKEAGFNPTVDASGKVLDNLSAVLGYLNQGSSDVNLGGRIPQIRWSPGAIATVFDQVTVRPAGPPGLKSAQPAGLPLADTASLSSRYIESGVTGFGGYVAVPTIDGYIRPQILFPAYVAGYNLAEAWYAASRYVNWRGVIIGDPLASPFAKTSLRQRSALADAYRISADAVTGLPEHFSKRRQLYLTQKYSTSTETIMLLLRAEAAAGKADADALALVEKSIEQDPYIAESHLLQAQIFEHQSDFAHAFDHYKKAVELGWNERETYLKLARLALDKLKDPVKAAGFTPWLYRHFGQTEPEIAELYADVELQNGRIDEAKSVFQHLVSDINPPPSFALARLGRIHYDQGDFEVARDLLARALERSGAESKADPAPYDSSMHVDQDEVRWLLDQAVTHIAKPKVEAASVSIGTPETRAGSDYPPRIVSRTAIPYPFDAHIDGIEGTVVVSLLIDEMGQVMKGILVSGNPKLAKAVMAAAKSWRFEPRLENGRAVPSWYTVPVIFKLKK
jgi:uncharacterized protein (TIGR03790 family)